MQETVFVVEHGFQSHAADITVGGPVNRVAERHVVGRYRLCNRSGSAADMEKTARHFLAGADLRERSVFLCVQVDLERLLVCANVHLRVHRQLKM